MVIVTLLVGLLALPIAARADDDTRPEGPRLTVTGTGHLSLEPDTAFVTLGMETADKALHEAQRQNQTAMQSVTQRLRALHIENERIQTTSFTVSPQYRSVPKPSGDAPPLPPEIIGYLVSNTVTVEVRNLEQVGVVIEEALTAGANRFQGLHWALRDEQQAKLDALKQAAAKARAKATALSEALKVRLIRLTSITEASHVVQPAPRVARAAMAMEFGGGEPPIFSGEINVEATVTLIYEIGQE
ncbi:hypothetical protein YTPLAS18_00920 [Nitrospira sp.]|nr:hypothetical protein YTPLAS18_00920 [Nitrospira sp.]